MSKKIIISGKFSAFEADLKKTSLEAAIKRYGSKPLFDEKGKPTGKTVEVPTRVNDITNAWNKANPPKKEEPIEKKPGKTD